MRLMLAVAATATLAGVLGMPLQPQLTDTATATGSATAHVALSFCCEGTGARSACQGWVCNKLRLLEYYTRALVIEHSAQQGT